VTKPSQCHLHSIAMRGRILETAHMMKGTFTAPQLAFNMRRLFKGNRVERAGVVGAVLRRDPHYERVGTAKVSGFGGGGNKLPLYQVRRKA